MSLHNIEYRDEYGIWHPARTRHRNKPLNWIILLTLTSGLGYIVVSVALGIVEGSVYVQ